MMHKNLTRTQGNPVCQRGEVMRKVITLLFLLFLFVAALPFQAYSAPTYPVSTDVRTTRQRVVSPLPIPDDPLPHLTIDKVDQYGPRGYSSWVFAEPGIDYGPLLPDGSPVGTYNPTERLLTFFSMSDIHIVDKESTAQAIYGAFASPSGFGETNTSAYSPIMLSTTHVLDAAVQTINALHSRTPFDFGISLGDDANSTQYNELRWFIDVMDGKKITPSSGAHRGANSIDYQMPYQAAGLDKSIPWYQTMGNHDQYWCGTLLFNDYARNILLGNTILDIDLVGTPPFPTFDGRGYYMGVIDGKTEYGTIIGAGPVETMAAPIIAADQNRRSLTTETSTTLNWMKEFFKTTSEPKGHGFTQANIDNDFASYTFEPKAGVPLKVIVIDDTCKENPYAAGSSYARACLDQTRYDWLVNELEQGQAEGKLMIIAAHIPVGPQLNVPDSPVPAGYPANTTIVALFLSTCHDDPTSPGVPCNKGIGIENNDPVPPYTVVDDKLLLQTLHNYSNLILWISGHRHINTVTPQPAPKLPVPKGPEFGFWEVETSSLRDFPQQFRTFEIVRNSNNTVSIFVTDVDPAVQGASPAAKSRGYAIGANRIAGGALYNGLTDATPHVYNAELIKQLASPYTITVNVTGPGTVNMGPYQAATCTSSTPCSAAYLPGTQVALAATAAPGAAFAGWSTCMGTSTCNITMTSDVTVTATFTDEPTLTVTPTYKDFGTIKIGKKATATFRVKNTAEKGIADLTIRTASIVGTDAGQFKLVAGKDRCSGKTIAPGKSCSFQVAFKPALANTRVATITLPSNDPDAPDIQITGIGK
jgi:hypothetical protein